MGGITCRFISPDLTRYLQYLNIIPKGDNDQATDVLDNQERMHVKSDHAPVQPDPVPRRMDNAYNVLDLVGSCHGPDVGSAGGYGSPWCGSGRAIGQGGGFRAGDGSELG